VPRGNENGGGPTTLGTVLAREGEAKGALKQKMLATEALRGGIKDTKGRPRRLREQSGERKKPTGATLQGKTVVHGKRWVAHRALW